MGGWRAFRQCLGCGYDIATGDGESGCSWGECAYLPEELDVFCPNCRFNFLTREGTRGAAGPVYASTPPSPGRTWRTSASGWS